MISSRADLRRYMEADLKARGLTRWRWHWRFVYPVAHWTRELRRIEYLTNVFRKSWLAPYVIARQMAFKQMSIRFGFTIPVNVFGPGLNIAHWGTITVSTKARIGDNCRIHPGVCLGTKNEAAPQIGDDCYLGPGAKLFGAVVLGHRVKVGANAVVNESFGDDSVLVGVPARDVKRR